MESELDVNFDGFSEEDEIELITELYLFEEGSGEVDLPLTSYREIDEESVKSNNVEIEIYSQVKKELHIKSQESMSLF